MSSLIVTERVECSCPAMRPVIEYLDSITGPADLDTLAGILGSLNLSREDISDACVFGGDAYRRNLVAESDWYEAVFLCWKSGQRTPIHDHKGSACAFLVIDGICTETRFNRTPSGLICPEWTAQHEPGYICASAEADIHQVANTQPAGRELVNLHIYSPPIRNYNVYSLDTMCASDPESIRHNSSVTH